MGFLQVIVTCNPTMSFQSDELLVDPMVLPRYIGGGRKHWDGSGGSNGALEHFEEDGQ